MHDVNSLHVVHFLYKATAIPSIVAFKEARRYFDGDGKGLVEN